jgi:glycosyltransferase involved in cell wall biosynthesis
MKILFLGPLPEPVTGQSLACKLFYDALCCDYEVVLIDMKKGSFRQGANSLWRVIEIFSMACQILRKRAGCDRVYFTISESIAGNLKDILFYILLLGKLNQTAVHLHGGAGLRILLSSAHPVLRILNGLFLRHLWRVIVLGERHVSMFDGLVEPARIKIVENFALDSLFISPKAMDAKYAAPMPLRLLFLSNLLPGKGYRELVAAVTALDHNQRCALEVHFAGGFEADNQRDAFLASIAGLSSVRYHGVVAGAAKRQLLAETHLFCLPTYYPYEGQPISILEAYASGCAVMTTDHSGIFDIFTPDENGFAVDKASPDSIRHAIEVALGNPELVAAIARRNRAMADERFRETIHLHRLKTATI